MNRTLTDVLNDSKAEPQIFYAINTAKKRVRIFDGFTYWKDPKVRQKYERSEHSEVFSLFRKSGNYCVARNGIVVAQYVDDLQAELTAMRDARKAQS